MKKKQVLHEGQGAETAEEIIGILTAISVVAKRMAKKLSLLERQFAEKEDDELNAKTPVSDDAD